MRQGTEMKPSWKSWSTWLTVASALVGALLTSGLFADGSMAFRILGAAQMVLSALGYQAIKTIGYASLNKANALIEASKNQAGP